MNVGKRIEIASVTGAVRLSLGIYLITGTTQVLMHFSKDLVVSYMKPSLQYATKYHVVSYMTLFRMT